MQRGICHESVEQARRFQKIDEERQLPKRRQRRLDIPFDANWAGETVEAHAFRWTLLFNRRLLTRRVKADKRNIVRHDPDNVAIRGKVQTSQLRFIGLCFHHARAFDHGWLVRCAGFFLRCSADSGALSVRVAIHLDDGCVMDQSIDGRSGHCGIWKNLAPSRNG